MIDVRTSKRLKMTSAAVTSPPRENGGEGIVEDASRIMSLRPFSVMVQERDYTEYHLAT